MDLIPDPSGPGDPAANCPEPDRDADLQLAIAARDGDRPAFEGLIERYQRVVFKIAIGKTRNREDADDLTQEIFLHAYKSLPNLRDPQAFLGWLMAIAHNRANRFLRTHLRKIVTLEEARQTLVERAKERESGVPSDGEMDELVRTLPDEYRLALTWKYIDGCSYDEIGERLSLSFHQVDYLLRKAKRALRTAVDRAENGGRAGTGGEGQTS